MAMKMLSKIANQELLGKVSETLMYQINNIDISVHALIYYFIHIV